MARPTPQFLGGLLQDDVFIVVGQFQIVGHLLTDPQRRLKAARPFVEEQKKRKKSLTPEERAEVEMQTRGLVEQELTLRDLRRAQSLTQERLAEMLGIEQDNVSRMERRADMLLSTMSSYVEAMGGKLRLVAEFPGREPAPAHRLSFVSPVRTCFASTLNLSSPSLRRHYPVSTL